MFHRTLGWSWRYLTPPRRTFSLSATGADRIFSLSHHRIYSSVHPVGHFQWAWNKLNLDYISPNLTGALPGGRTQGTNTHAKLMLTPHHFPSISQGERHNAVLHVTEWGFNITMSSESRKWVSSMAFSSCLLPFVFVLGFFFPPHTEQHHLGEIKLAEISQSTGEGLRLHNYRGTALGTESSRDHWSVSGRRKWTDIKHCTSQA